MFRRSSLRLAAVVAPVVLIGAFLAAPPVAAGSCNSGSGDTPPEGRPYRPGAGAQVAENRKFLARTTINADGISDRCDCTKARDWEWGMDPRAVASIRSAIIGKEAMAISNYAKFGVPAEQVPTVARTIWFRTTWRSRSEQICLRSVFGSGAALPGTSKHEWGIAVDLEDWGPRHGGIDAKLLEATGWCRTVRSEPWHYEYRPALGRIGQLGRCIK